MGTHLAEQAKKRHEDYLRAEVVSLRERLTQTEQALHSVTRRLNQLEAWVGMPGA